MTSGPRAPWLPSVPLQGLRPPSNVHPFAQIVESAQAPVGNTHFSAPLFLFAIVYVSPDREILMNKPRGNITGHGSFRQTGDGHGIMTAYLWCSRLQRPGGPSNDSVGGTGRPPVQLGPSAWPLGAGTAGCALSARSSLSFAAPSGSPSLCPRLSSLEGYPPCIPGTSNPSLAASRRRLPKRL